MSGSVEEVIAKLVQLENLAGDDPGKLQEVDDAYESSLSSAPYLVPILVLRNRFRLRHAARLKARRPRVLIGGMNDGNFPNFHTAPLLRVADVVGLTTTTAPAQIERVSYAPFSDSFGTILSRLPKGFQPDLFFDNQVESHMLPYGIEDAPFPTVAAFCHHFRQHQIDALSELFDYVLPLSKGFAAAARKRGLRAQVLDLPFGLNWGSFHHFITPGTERPVDLAVTFSGSEGAIYLDHRRDLYERMRRFADGHSARYRIEFASGLDKPSYLALLRRSRIVLNVAGVHGPYNYRLCEAAAAGALVVHYHYEGPVPCDIRDYLRDGEEIVVATGDTLEDTISRYLDDREGAERIAKAGARALRERYSYETLYTTLFERVRADKAAGRAIAAGKPQQARARALLGRAYLEWAKPAMAAYTAHALEFILQQPAERLANDLMVLLPVMIEAGLLEGLASALQGVVDLSKGRQSLPAALDALAKQAGGGPIALWNRAILRASSAAPSPVFAQAALQALENAGDLAAWEEWLTACCARPNYFSDAEWEASRLRLRAFGRMRAGGDRTKEQAAERDWMLWHLHRMLMECAASPKERAAHLEACARLFPDNPVQDAIKAQDAAAGAGRDTPRFASAAG